MKKYKTIFIISVLFILLLIGKIVVPTKEKETAAVLNKDHSDMAFIISKTFVKNNLDAPLTANFPTANFKARNEGGENYFLQYDVDFKNLNNVSLRKTFQISLHFKGGDEANNSNWELIKINSF